jgi:hypothetical protein
MDFISFIILCGITLVIAYVGTLIIRLLVPTHPLIVDQIIWGVAIAIIVWTLIRATGILSYAPQIPHV